MAIEWYLVIDDRRRQKSRAMASKGKKERMSDCEQVPPKKKHYSQDYNDEVEMSNQ